MQTQMNDFKTEIDEINDSKTEIKNEIKNLERRSDALEERIFLMVKGKV